MNVALSINIIVKGKNQDRIINDQNNLNFSNILNNLSFFFFLVIYEWDNHYSLTTLFQT